MRKLLVLLLLLVLLAGCGAAPISTAPPTAPPATTEPRQLKIFIGEDGAERSGVNMVIESIDSMIHARWKNDSGWNITFGNDYDIEMLSGDTWTSCRTEDLTVTDIAYELETGKFAEMDYSLSEYDISREGTYRLKSQCAIQEGDQAINCSVWAQFVVSAADSQPVDPDITLLQDVQSCKVSAQFIRTNGYHEDIAYPIITVIRSVAELNAYYEANKNQYDLERIDKTHGGASIGFLDACDQYDDDYFAKQALILILLEEGSGSICHAIHKAGFSGDKFVVSLDSYLPGGLGTADMAQWHIFVEPEAGLKIPDEIALFRNGKFSNKKTTSVSYHYGYANMTLQLLDGWEYATQEYTDECDRFGIDFWPVSYPEHKVSLLFCPNGDFGSYTAELNEEEVISLNHTGKVGIHDGQSNWSYLVYEDLAGQYAADLSASSQWWDIYSKDLKKMLLSTTLADGYIREYQAVNMAIHEAHINENDYDRRDTSFDYTTGTWTVVLSSSFRRCPVITVYLDATGTVLNITSDE